jgi:hypothetical protein
MRRKLLGSRADQVQGEREATCARCRVLDAQHAALARDEGDSLSQEW